MVEVSLSNFSKKTSLIPLIVYIPEIPLPNEQARMDILKIHSAKITKHGDIGKYMLFS